MTFKELRQRSGMNQTEFANYFGIPRRTVQNWEGGQRQCPEYLLDLMKYKLNHKEAHGRWEFIREPNTVDGCGNPVYYARCTECGFVWTDLYAVKTYFDNCPKCGAKMEK